MIDRELAKSDFYHGLLPREDMKEMLTTNGDWLLRMTEPTEPGRREFVISVQTDVEKNNIRHYIVSRKGDKFAVLGNLTFDSILELVKHYMKEGVILTTPPVELKRPITRRKWELDHDDIEITKKLGEGAFGEVSKGILKRRRSDGREKKIDVAIKQAKLDGMTKDQIKDLMREARLMRHFDHINIVRLYGVAAGQEPLMIVMELASRGALDSYLARHEDLSQEKRIEMTVQAGWGIEYLHKKNCLHRDIASRNCLYGGGQVKISDFGLSRIGETYQMNPKNKVPIRWLAPETLNTARYSQKTDVWSYGILAWEIFNNGIEPYPNLTNVEVIHFVKAGKHLTISEKCTNAEFCKIIEDHAVQENCLEFKADDRMKMADVILGLEGATGLKQPGKNESGGLKNREAVVEPAAKNESGGLKNREAAVEPAAKTFGEGCTSKMIESKLERSMLLPSMINRCNDGSTLYENAKKDGGDQSGGTSASCTAKKVASRRRKKRHLHLMNQL